MTLQANQAMQTANTAALTNYPLHTRALVLWLVAALLPALLTKNPLYLLLVLAAAGFTYRRLVKPGPAHEGWGSFLKLGLVLVALSTLFNLLFISAGATLLFTLPEYRLEVGPETQRLILLRLGGRVTLESLAYGLSSGLALMAVLVVFATFNALVDHYQLLRAMPRFLYQSAIVLSIAITFIPQMMVAQREIRQAQALRGHRFRGLRDLLPLFVTLLAEGLERSLSLAESMEARGFASSPRSSPTLPPLAIRGAIALALALLLSGLVGRSYFADAPWPGLLLALLGGGLLLGSLWLVGRRVRRSRYRRDLWRRHDSLVAGAALISLLITTGVWLSQREALIFYPYPRFAWPAFDPLLGLALLLIAAPVFAGAPAPGGVSWHD